MGLADAYPGATFQGFEPSSEQVEMARQTAARAGISNVSFGANLPAAGGAVYDYVVCDDPLHTSETLAQVLSGCQALLSVNGVALVSFDTLPGARLRQVVRAIASRIGAATGSTDNATALRAALAIMSSSPAGGRGVELLQDEIVALGKLDDAHLQAELSLEREAFTLQAFTSLAADFGLVFLSEGVHSTTSLARFQGKSREFLDGVPSRLEREQYLDFLSGRKLRRTLLCRAEASVAESIEPSRLRELWLLSPLRPEPQEAQVFRAPGGARVRVTEPALGKILSLLGEVFPEAVSFSELAARLKQIDSNTNALTPAELETVVLSAYERELLDLLSSRPRCVRTPGVRPRVSRLAALELELGRRITSRLHFPVSLRSPLAGRLLSLLDGTRTLEGVVESLPSQEHATLEQVRSEVEALARQGLVISEAEPATEVFQ